MKLVNSVISAIVLFGIIVGCGKKEEKKENISSTSPKIEDVKEKPLIKMSLGQRTFMQCAACHNLKQDEPHKVGPNLNGLFGRKAGSLEDFNYSEALKASDIVWNEEHIRAWLEKPSKYVPGTIMLFVGVKNKEQQDVLIKYLKEETK